ncbi:MAG: hypothetical protein AB7V08_14280 [Elusimicrobiales bacterium]
MGDKQALLRILLRSGPGGLGAWAKRARDEGVALEIQPVAAAGFVASQPGGDVYGAGRVVSAEGDGDEGAAALGIVVPSAPVAPSSERSGNEVIVPVPAITLSSACRNWTGNALPRRAARRRMPAQAFGLKKYCGGTFPASKMSDNEDTAASLGSSEEL